MAICVAAVVFVVIALDTLEKWDFVAAKSLFPVDFLGDEPKMFVAIKSLGPVAGKRWNCRWFLQVWPIRSKLMHKATHWFTALVIWRQKHVLRLVSFIVLRHGCPAATEFQSFRELLDAVYWVHLFKARNRWFPVELVCSSVSVKRTFERANGAISRPQRGLLSSASKNWL